MPNRPSPPNRGAVGAPRGDAATSDQAGSGERAATDPLADPGRQRSIVRTAQITVEVEQLSTSTARVRQVALDARGFVASETTGFGQPVDPIPLGQQDQRAGPLGRRR